MGLRGLDTPQALLSLPLDLHPAFRKFAICTRHSLRGATIAAAINHTRFRPSSLQG